MRIDRRVSFSILTIALLAALGPVQAETFVEFRDGRYIERLGYYNPKAVDHEQSLRVDLERFDHWVGQGAQPSAKAAALVKSFRKEGQQAA